MQLPTSSCHGVLYPRYYGLVGTFSSKPPGGSRGVVLLSPRVWKGCQWLGTRDWYLMHYSSPSVIGGQKHTHTKRTKHTSTLLTHDLALPLIQHNCGNSRCRTRLIEHNSGNTCCAVGKKMDHHNSPQNDVALANLFDRYCALSPCILRVRNVTFFAQHNFPTHHS